MKFIHTGDLHIGKIVNEFSMLNDQIDILEQIFSVSVEEKADAIIISGDIYDRSIPPAEAVAVLDSFLTELTKKRIAVLMISGNHDSPERIGFAKEILKERGIYIAGTFSAEMEPVRLEDEFGTVNFFLLPFAKPPVMRHFLETEETSLENTYDACVREAVERMQMNSSERNVLVSHHFVTNCGVTPEVSDSEARLSVGGAENVEADAFKEFDYVALGHIHQAQRAGADWIRYSGSPLKYSFSEVFHKKSVTVVELGEKGKIQIKERGLIPLHDMRKIKGKLKNLIRDEVVEVGNREDYIQVTLTDEEELMDPIGTLRSVYPNIMQLLIEKNIRDELREISFGSEMRSRSTLMIYQEFYENVTGRKFDEQRREIIQKELEELEGGNV